MENGKKEPVSYIIKRRRRGYVLGIIVGLSLGLLGIMFLIFADSVALEYEAAEKSYNESVASGHSGISEGESTVNAPQTVKKLKRELNIIRAVNFMCEKGCYFLFVVGAAILSSSVMSLDVR